ncbi:MAG: TRAP transporter large permease subunit [Spirochaetaceae bacterium]|jgi:tripartite ATP-independent transporter DctM subunit|nr:TRAP transporter large permease subunit [Spirochaetaceae bacterium]
MAVLKKIETGLCYVSLALLALLPLCESVARLVFHSAIPSEQATLCQLLLVVSMFSAMLTTKNSEHLSIGLVQYTANKAIKKICGLAGSLISCWTCTVLFFAAAAFIKLGLTPPTLIGFIPDTVYALVLPFGFAIMAVRFARRAPVSGIGRILPILAILAGIVCALPMIFKFLWGFDLSDAQFNIVDFFYTMASGIKMPAVIILIFAALAGTPLFIVLGTLSILLIGASGGEIDVTINQVYTGLTGQNFIAIPLFTLAGFFLSESRAGTRLVRTFQSLFSWFPGGMIAASVLLCAFFTSFTGASGVTILALGGILYTILYRGGSNDGYSSRFSVGLLTSSGSIGLLFPPSLPLILVGTITQTSILNMFVGGIVPGILLSVSMVVFGIIVSVKTKVPIQRFNAREALNACKHSCGEIILPVFLIVGYFSGILSLVEIGAFAVVYVFVLEVIIFKDIKLKDVGAVFAKAVPIIGGILAILGLSQALSYYIVDTQAPENFARWMGTAISSKFVFLIILNVALLIVGCLVDIFSAIVIVLPLIAPLGAAYGLDPVHIGIIFLINMEAGFLTPPVGLNLFLASYRFKTPFTTICRAVFPFLLIQLAVVLLVTYCPPLTMGLVNLLRK